MTPKGWKLVPEDATPEMLAAGESAASVGIGKCADEDAMPRVWRDMLAASPPPPVEWSDEVRLALLKAEQAIVDWGNLYAPDECYEETVAAAKERIREAGGTLGYLADALGSIRAALTAIGAKDAD